MGYYVASYDNRKGNIRPSYHGMRLSSGFKANLSYITVEPSLRFAPFKSNFYLYGGPRLAFNMDKSFTYQLVLIQHIQNKQLILK
jgi:hypothetical protein